LPGYEKHGLIDRKIDNYKGMR